MTRDEFHRWARIGGGGWSCPCCGPKPLDRPVWRRIARRRLKRADQAEWKKGE